MNSGLSLRVGDLLGELRDYRARMEFGVVTSLLTPLPLRLVLVGRGATVRGRCYNSSAKFSTVTYRPRQRSIMCHRADHREPESVGAESVAAVARLRAELRRAEREIRKPAPCERGAARGGGAADPRCACAGALRVHRSAPRPVQRETFLCSVLVTDCGSYYAWVRAGHKRRECEYDDRRLTALILVVHTAHPA